MDPEAAPADCLGFDLRMQNGCILRKAVIRGLFSFDVCILQKTVWITKEMDRLFMSKNERFSKFI